MRVSLSWHHVTNGRPCCGRGDWPQRVPDGTSWPSRPRLMGGISIYMGQSRPTHRLVACATGAIIACVEARYSAGARSPGRGRRVIRRLGCLGRWAISTARRKKKELEPLSACDNSMCFYKRPLHQRQRPIGKRANGFRIFRPCQRCHVLGSPSPNGWLQVFSRLAFLEA